MDDEQRVVIDATITTAAAGLIHDLPLLMPGFLEVNSAHARELDRLKDADDDRWIVFEQHGPMIDDGPVCESCGEIYPCRVVRAVHDGSRVWDEYVRQYPPGWENW